MASTTTQTTWPLPTAWPGSTASSVTTPARWAVISFSIFIASTMQITWPGCDLVALGDLDCEHGALHRRDHGVLGAAVSTGGDSLAAPARELGVRRLRHERLDLVAAAVQLQRQASRPRRGAVGLRRNGGLLLGQLLRPLGQLLGLDHAVARRALDEARVLEQRPVKAEQRRDAADLELAERAQHPPARVLAVDVVDDQLRDERVVEVRDLRAGDDARVDAHAGARRAPGSS